MNNKPTWVVAAAVLLLVLAFTAVAFIGWDEGDDARIKQHMGIPQGK